MLLRCLHDLAVEVLHLPRESVVAGDDRRDLGGHARLLAFDEHVAVGAVRHPQRGRRPHEFDAKDRDARRLWGRLVGELAVDDRVVVEAAEKLKVEVVVAHVVDEILYLARLEIEDDGLFARAARERLRLPRHHVGAAPLVAGAVEVRQARRELAGVRRRGIDAAAYDGLRVGVGRHAAQEGIGMNFGRLARQVAVALKEVGAQVHFADGRVERLGDGQREAHPVRGGRAIGKALERGLCRRRHADFRRPLRNLEPTDEVVVHPKPPAFVQPAYLVEEVMPRRGFAVVAEMLDHLRDLLAPVPCADAGGGIDAADVLSAEVGLEPRVFDPVALGDRLAVDLHAA